MTRRLPITVLLAVAVTLPALLVAGALFLVSFSVAERNTAELTRDKAELLLDNLASRIEGHLRPVEHLTHSLAGALLRAEALDDPDARDARIMAVMRDATGAFPQLSGIAWVEAGGRVYRILKSPASESRLTQSPDDPAVRSFLTDARNRAGGYWGDFVLPDAAKGGALLNYRLPISTDGRFLGVLGLGVAIGDLSRYLEGLQDQGGPEAFGTSFILLGEDRVIAHPMLQWNFPGLSPEEPLPRILAFPDPVLTELFGGRAQQPPERYRSEGYEARWFELADSLYIGFYRKLTGFTDQPFTIGTVTLASEIDEQVRRLGLLPAIGGGLVLVTLIGGILLGRGLAGPIKRLREGARRVQSLELEGHPGFGRSRVREMDDAQRAFDAMVVGLRLFALYVPRGLVRRLIQIGLSEGPLSEERRLTLMFTDIVGFTSVSERLPAREVSALLNHHFALLGAAVEAEGGTIDKFIGDALMAFWGAPEPLEDSEVRAARAALAIARALEAENADLRASGRAPVRLRIGLHAGPVVVGNIGSPDRVNYTVIGDAVNTAQRLEGLGKEVAGDEPGDCVILISEEVRRALGAGFECRDLGDIPVKGREEPIRVYRLLDAPEA